MALTFTASLIRIKSDKCQIIGHAMSLLDALASLVSNVELLEGKGHTACIVWSSQIIQPFYDHFHFNKALSKSDV